VGVGVGVGVGVPLLIALMGVSFLLVREKRSRHHFKSGEYPQTFHDEGFDRSHTPQEMPSESAVKEMPTGVGPHEVYGDRPGY
jgi:hypothetical protein